jgi:flavin reductase (DIM6/NTAB) family NADH-FMN oxidoreductase RutF
MGTKDAFHELVSGIDYPMFIVTAAGRGQRDGCLVGFVTQASICPPRMIVMLSKANRTYEVSQDADRLVVHFLHRDNDDLATLFGERTGDEVDKFAVCKWQEGPAHEVVLLGTRGWVSGTILARHDAGDHVAHLIDVTDAITDTPGAQLPFQSVVDMQPGHPA